MTMQESGQAENALLERFFGRMRTAILDSDRAGGAIPKKSIRFTVNGSNWCLDANQDFMVKHWMANEPALCECECSISTDMVTLSAIANGKIRPMQAYLSGKLVFVGDRATLKDYGDAIRVAIERSPASEPTARHLSVRILTASTEQFSDDSHETFVKYIIQVTDTSRNLTWKVRRRFSEFIKLRSSLTSLGFSVPAIKGRRYLYSNDAVISYRINHLEEFLQAVLLKVPNTNYLISAFLINDQRTNYIVQLHNPNKNNTDNGDFKQAIEDIFTHLASFPMPYRVDSLTKNVDIINEFFTLRKRLAVVENITNHLESGGLLALLTTLLRHSVMVSMMLSFLSAGVLAHPLYYVACLIYLGLTQTHLLLVKYLLVGLLGAAFSGEAANMWATVTQSTYLGVGDIVTAVYSLTSTFRDAYLTRLTHLCTRSVSEAGMICDMFLNLFTTGMLSYVLTVFIVGLYTIALVSIFVMYKKKVLRTVEIYALGVWLIGCYVLLKVFCKVLRLSDPQADMLYDVVDRHLSVYITHKLSQFKSIFIKFAQYLSLRNDVLGKHWIDRLSKLQDQCMESSQGYVRKTLEDSLNEMFQRSEGGKVVLEDVFDGFQASPVASASIAQVHFAHLNLVKLKSLRRKINTSSKDWNETLKALDDMLQVVGHSHPLFTSSTHTEGVAAVSTGNIGFGVSNRHLLAVAIKVQHEDIQHIMPSDMNIVLNLSEFAAKLDDRWKVSLSDRCAFVADPLPACL